MLNNLLIIGHFGHDERHNEMCAQTASLLRHKYNFVAARTPYEMTTTPTNSNSFYLFPHHINQDTHAELLDSRSIAGKPKIVMTNTRDMIIAANERQIPVISFSCEFAGVAGHGFYAASPEAAATEIKRINADRLAFLQGLQIPVVA